MQPKIKLVFGRICSGKSSLKRDPLRDAVIEVSHLVKTLIKRSNREALQNTVDLDMEIAELLLNRIAELEAENAWSVIVIDGIRQASIVQQVLERYPEVELVWVEVPTEERKRRYYARQHPKDIEPFEIVDNREIELEGQKIFDTFRNRLTIINNY